MLFDGIRSSGKLVSSRSQIQNSRVLDADQFTLATGNDGQSGGLEFIGW